MTDKIKEIAESKITVLSGTVLVLIFAIIVSGTSILFNHNSRIAVEERRSVEVEKELGRFMNVPEILGRMDENIKALMAKQKIYGDVSEESNRKLKTMAR